MRSKLRVPHIVWCQTVIDISLSTNTRALTDSWRKGLPLRDPPVRYRNQERGESKLWQCALPGYDFDTWAKGGRWMVNPHSGHELSDKRAHDRSYPCYLRHPDLSFWEAAGFHTKG